MPFPVDFNGLVSIHVMSIFENAKKLNEKKLDEDYAPCPDNIHVKRDYTSCY